MTAPAPPSGLPVQAGAAQPGTLLSIQYLRGLAALVVVLVHVGWVSFPAGAAGVDVFFVISGFIMAHVSRREVTPGAFLRARAWRVLPLYWLLTALAVALRPVDTVPRIAASFLLWPSMRADGEIVPVLVQGWTLIYEASFYVAFALVLLLPPGRRLGALTIGLLAACAAGALVPGLLTTPGVSPLLLPEFLAGVWLHRAWQAGRLPSARVGVGTALAAAAAILLLPQGGSLPWRPIAWGLPALLIVAGLLAVEAGGRLPVLASLKRLGDASYSLYLTHVIVMWGAKPALIALPLPVAYPIVVAACLVVGIATHRCIEVPLGRWPQRRRRALARSGAAA